VLREVVGEAGKSADSAAKQIVAPDQSGKSTLSPAAQSASEKIVTADSIRPRDVLLSAASQSFPAEEAIYCEAVNVPPVPSSKDVARPASREALYREIVAAFVEATGYPDHVFTEEAALDTTLGIDSLKQMEVLSELEARYHLPACLKLFRSGEQGTLRRITDFVYHALLADAVHIDEHITAVPLPTVAPAFVPSESDMERQRLARLAQSAARPGANLSRPALQLEIVALYADAMGYPPEVFTEDARLDTELGIDSVKQMELFSKLEARYQLPARPETFRLSDYGTMRKVTDFIYQGIGRPAAQSDERFPVYAVG
jgi:acyl carrier protein